MQKLKLKTYRLSRKLSSGKWKYVSAYDSTFDQRYQEDINKLRSDGYKLKCVKIIYDKKGSYSEYPIFEDK